VTACGVTSGIAGEVAGINTSVVVTIGRVSGVTETRRAGVVEVTVLVVLSSGVVAVMDRTETCSSCATSNVLGYTLKLIVTLLASGQGTALRLELAHGHRWQSSGLVVSGSVVVDLMDGDSGVDDVGLDGLLLDNRLNGLVDVMMNVLAANGGSDALALSGSFYTPFILELSLLLDKVPLSGVVVAVIEFAVLDGTKLRRVLLWQHLAVLNWLKSAVIVILVNLLVYRCDDLFMLVRLDRLVNDRRSNCLVDSGVMVS